MTEGLLRWSTVPVLINDTPAFLLGNTSARAYYELTSGLVQRTPCVTVIQGQYGLGKTSLIHQLAAYLKRHHSDFAWRTPQILPFALGGLHGKAKDANGVAKPENFARLILQRFAEGMDNNQEILIELASRIHSGQIILVLDGLDEMFDVKDIKLHDVFYDGLISFVMHYSRANGEAPRFKLIVTVRTEFLQRLAALLWTISASLFLLVQIFMFSTYRRSASDWFGCNSSDSKSSRIGYEQ